MDSQEAKDPSPQSSLQPEAPSAPAAPAEQSEAPLDLDSVFNPQFEDSPEPTEDGFRESVARMFRGGTEGADAAKQVLRDLGYDEPTISRFVEQASYQGQAPAAQEAPRAEVPKELVDEIRMANQRAQVAEERARAVRARQLEQELDHRVHESMGSPELGEFLGGLDSLNEEGDEKSRSDRRELMSEEIRRTALDNLGQRTRRAGTFEESWIGEEVQRATRAVQTKYKAAIGTVNRVGRASSTFGPEDEIRQRKPVSPPSWKPGKQASDMDSEIRDWTVDVLSRAALGGGTGETKL